MIEAMKEIRFFIVRYIYVIDELIINNQVSSVLCEVGKIHDNEMN